MAVEKCPKGFHTLTPYLVVRDAARAIEFYKKAFGATEIMRMPGPDGERIMHAEIRIGNSPIMMTEENADYGKRSPQALKGTPMSLLIYDDNVDAAFKRAVAAGATPQMEPQDMFWGDRWSSLTDPFGHEWQIATHIEDVPQQELGRRAKEFFANPGC
jgi:PhnB protein